MISQIKDKNTSIIATITVAANNIIAKGMFSKSPKNGKLSLKFSHATGM